MELKNIFRPGKIGKVEIKNRIVRSATLEGRADKGAVTQDLINLYEKLAAGGSGLIITGGCSVDKSGSSGNTQTHIFNDSFIEGQKKLVDSVHKYDEAKIAIQLVHVGRQGFYPDHPPIAPSAVYNAFTKQTPKEVTLEEIDYLIQCFLDAGKRAYECGYDLIQLHAAHGTLLNNFLSPYMNRRTDEFGGTTEKRSKMLVDIYTKLKEEIGKDYPIFVKLQTIDGFSNGIDLEEAKKIAQILIKIGCAAIEPSGGSSETAFRGNKVSYSPPINKPEEENYFLPNAKELKTIERCCPIILVGGVRNPHFANNILGKNIVDFISMSRPLIREPNLPNRWRDGDLHPVECISCNGCLSTVFKGTHCVQEKRETRKKKRNSESK